MKKFLKIICSIICIFCICSCSSNEYHHSDSLKDYIESIPCGGNSSLGIDYEKYILPSTGFLTDYNYTEGEYHWYWRNGYSDSVVEASIIRLTYNDAEYVLAKDFSLDNMFLSKKNQFKYNNYFFIENLMRAQHYGELNLNEQNIKFPNVFMMFCYNDLNNTLIFIGYYAGTKLEEKSNLFINDIGLFLKNTYGEYYDFS